MKGNLSNSFAVGLWKQKRKIK